MDFSPIRFGTDSGNLRTEDEPLVGGRGRFTDDIHVDGQAYAAFLRADRAHARIEAVDLAPARSMPGVLAAFSGADLERAGVGPIPPIARFPGRDGKPMVSAAMPILAVDRVRFVGEPVAMVVAETPEQAQDAAEAVEVAYRDLPSACDVESALRSPPLHEDAPGNLALDWTDGDAAAVERAFASAAHVERVRLADPRVAVVSLEPRAGIGSWDEAGQRYTLIASTQGVAIVRKLLAEAVFKVPHSQVRVLTPDVGGGFGMKAQTYPEYGAILFAARQLGRPVKWSNKRVESFLSDSAGRDCVLDGEMAFDGEGRILALRVGSTVGLGAYTTQFASIFGTANTKNCLSSVYRIPAIQTDVRLILTNTAPLGPYRGAGRPEAIYVIERLLDRAAAKLGIDRVSLRRRNLIAPDEMPYSAPNGQTYDSGEFEAVLGKAVALAGWEGFEARRAAAEARGKLRGIGLCCFLEVAGGILNEDADLRFEPDGNVAIRLGVQAMGQGHLSTLPRVVARQLGVDVAKVKLVEGDSDEVPDGTPSVASRSLMMAGSASARACEAAVEKGVRVFSHLFEVGERDVEFRDGVFRVAGTDLQIPILELAARARQPGLPDELAGGLDSRATFVSPQMSFPNGCHVCEVEIDPETGVVAVVSFVAVDDVGVIVHEAIVDGQTHGGIAQGLGQVLGEELVYGEDGQLQTASLMDYPLPRAADLPTLLTAHHSVPCRTNPLGVKGAGESGVAGSLPSAMNAIAHALSFRGIEQIDMPATPFRVWQSLNARSA